MKRTFRIYPYITFGFYFTCVLEELAFEIRFLLSFKVFEFVASLKEMRFVGVVIKVFKTVPTELSYCLHIFNVFTGQYVDWHSQTDPTIQQHGSRLALLNLDTRNVLTL